MGTLEGEEKNINACTFDWNRIPHLSLDLFSLPVQKYRKSYCTTLGIGVSINKNVNVKVLHQSHQGVSNEHSQQILSWRNKKNLKLRMYTANSRVWPVSARLTSLGPVVQSVVSLTSSLRVISLTVLLTFFQQKISAYLHITRCKFKRIVN